MYDDPQQQQQAQAQGQQQAPMSEEERRMMEEEAYYRQGDPWYGKPVNDTALQTREALWPTRRNAVDPKDAINEIEELIVNSISRLSRIPTIDKQTFKRLVRDAEDLIDRLHSQGKTNIILSRWQKFHMKCEMLVSVGENQMTGLTGIGAMITQNVNQKQEIRMPQQPAAPSLFSGLTGMLPGSKR